MLYPENYLPAWAEIETSSTVLNWLKNGIDIPFESIPQPFRHYNKKISVKEQQFLQSEIKRLKNSGIIVEDNSVQYISPISCVPKRNKKLRLIFDLRHLNGHINTPHFKYEDINYVLDIVEPNDKIITVDIKDGFFHVPVSKSSQRFLGFSFEGKTYKWCRLPFGLSVSPYFFCKTLRPIVNYLRSLGIRISVYVDDFILFADDHSINKQRDNLLDLLQKLGILVNIEKSDIVPTYSKEYIGYIISTDCDDGVYVKIPNRRITKLRHDISIVLKNKTVTARALARITGQCVSMAKAIIPAKLLLRNLYNLLKQRLSWQDNLTLDNGCIEDLQWWMSSLKSWNGRSVKKAAIDVQMTTDASTTGWGGHLMDMEAQGLWTPEFRYKNSNCREMMAVYLTMLSFRHHIRDKHVQVLSDNISTVANIRFQGGPSRDLTYIAALIWKEALQNNVTLTTSYLAGNQNCQADFLSRITLPSDWRLNPNAFRYLNRVWGPHSIDRFASMTNTQLPVYNSWHYDPTTSGIDCLAQQDWAEHNNFINPPFCLIPRILDVIQKQRALGTLIAPLWKSKMWFQRLQKMSLCPPIRLRNSKMTCLRESLDVLPEPLKNKKWKLYAWRISGEKP